MTGAMPDPARLAAARQAVHGYVRRKQQWTTGLFITACVAEVGFFGAMLAFFDFSDRFYWFIFFGLSLVYCPLITFVFRNSVVVDRLYYRLLWELKYGQEVQLEQDGEPPLHEVHPHTPASQVQYFLRQKEKWSKVLFWVSGSFELACTIGLLYFMDFSQQIHWFIFLGVLGVYSPLITATWRNAFAIDRVFYGLVDELKFSTVAGESALPRNQVSPGADQPVAGPQGG